MKTVRERFATARWALGALHAGLGLYLGSWLAESGWSWFGLAGMAVPTIATLSGRRYGPPLGILVLAAFLTGGIWIGWGGSRMTASLLVSVGIAAPTFLSSGLRSALAARGRPSDRPLRPGELRQILAAPVALSGLALPIIALLGRVAPRTVAGAADLMVQDAVPVVAFLWVAVLGAYVIHGFASLVAFRRLGPSEAQVYLLDQTGESSGREEARLWRKFLRARRRRGGGRKGVDSPPGAVPLPLRKGGFPS